jgi:hypothetical protein
MGRIVIVAYRPLPGMDVALSALVATHVPTLRVLGLATSRPTLAMKAADGAIVEVFEWASEAAIAAAHSHPDVLAMWERFGKVCEYVPLSSLEEAGHPFSEFAPLE